VTVGGCVCVCACGAAQLGEQQDADGVDDDGDDPSAHEQSSAADADAEQDMAVVRAEAVTAASASDRPDAPERSSASLLAYGRPQPLLGGAAAGPAAGGGADETLSLADSAMGYRRCALDGCVKSSFTSSTPARLHCRLWNVVFWVSAGVGGNPSAVLTRGLLCGAPPSGLRGRRGVRRGAARVSWPCRRALPWLLPSQLARAALPPHRPGLARRSGPATAA
jgi:hypothetical protein